MWIKRFGKMNFIIFLDSCSWFLSFWSLPALKYPLWWLIFRFIKRKNQKMINSRPFFEWTYDKMIFQLCAEDHSWWWRCFFVSGGSSFYVFAYSIFYFVTKLGLVHFRLEKTDRNFRVFFRCDNWYILIHGTNNPL